jgi:predicted outer membrane repeat protein
VKVVILKFIVLFFLFYSSLFSEDFIVGSAKEFHLALKSSENNQEDDNIFLKRGRYISSARYPFSYESKEDFDITIESADGESRSDVIIDGNGINSALQFKNDKYRIIVSISKVTIQNGYTKKKGGGVLMENSGELNLDDVVVAYNRSEYDGAGIYNSGTVIINRSMIAKNSSSRGVGGGVFSAKNVIIKESKLLNNSSRKHGGAIYSEKTTLIEDSLLSFNSSGYGGAFYGLTKLRVTNSTFSNNSAKYDGGAVKCTYARVADVNLSNNGSNNYGGAIYSDKLNITNSNLSKNSAKYGGAIFSEEATIKQSDFSENFAGYSGGAVKSNKIIIKDSKIVNNRSRRSGGAFASTQIVITNSDLIKNRSYKGGAIFSKNSTITNSILKRNSASNSGGAIKGFDIKVRYSTLCNNFSERVGGAIDGVNVTVTNSNVSKNRSYKGGAIHSFHVAKLNITSSLLFQNSATYGGAIFGNTKIFNSLIINNFGKGMSLYGKGSIVGSVIKNITARDLISQEIFMTGNLELENNFLTLSNIYNHELYRLKTMGNTPVSAVKNREKLEEIFGKHEIAGVGIEPDRRASCEDLFDTKNAYKDLLEISQINSEFDIGEEREEDEEQIELLSKDRERGNRSGFLPDISDLMVEGEQKIYSELYFVTVVRNGKNKIDKYFVDFDEGNGFEEIRGNSATHRFHTTGLKDVKVKIVDTEGNLVEKSFPVEIYDLSQDEFKEVIRDGSSREYLESLSRGVLDVADNPDGTKYNRAIDLQGMDSESINKINPNYKKLFAKLGGENSDEYNLSKMIQFNDGVNEVKEYILGNLEEFNLVSKDESIEAIGNAKRYILENPQEFNLTSFKNYEEVVIDIEHRILRNLDEYNLTEKKNLNRAYKDGEDNVLKNPKKFDLVDMKQLEEEMVKLTAKIRANPSKYGIRVTRDVLDNLPEGWSLLGTLAEIKDVTIFDGFKIVWIFANGEFQGYSPVPDIRKKIRNSQFKVFNRVPKNAGLWLYK